MSVEDRELERQEQERRDQRRRENEAEKARHRRKRDYKPPAPFPAALVAELLKDDNPGPRILEES